MSAVRAFAAVDLGASSGRVMCAVVGSDGIELREVHRFSNRPVRVRGTLHWDVLALWAGIQDGLRRCGPIDGIGVDSWGVDYGLLDEHGALLTNPVHYRDGRTDGVVERVTDTYDPASQYETTGVQAMPYNTVFQLVAAADTCPMRNAASALLIPDLFGYWLTGQASSELTIASTTGLLDIRRRTWSDEVTKRLGLRTNLFPPVHEPGTALGQVLPSVADECGIDQVPVYSVASHDTASAVLGVPARNERFAYISCGTWSLVGVEVRAPLTTEAARLSEFSNELGVDRTVRFLHNTMGLWLLQESVRTWERAGVAVDLSRLLTAAAELPARRSVIDPDRPEFLPTGDIPSRLRAECRRTGQPVPESPAEIARCILDSLADAYCLRIRQAAELTGTPVDVVHVVGGGAHNGLLCQLTADACQLPVVAGPIEAAAYGNALLQARAVDIVSGGRMDLRTLLPSSETVTYFPRS